VQEMIKLLLGLAQPPSPHDAADALAVALCHLHSMPPGRLKAASTSDGAPGRLKPAPTSNKDVGAGFSRPGRKPRTWREYRPPTAG
jgi:hypothetical protein